MTHSTHTWDQLAAASHESTKLYLEDLEAVGIGEAGKEISTLHPLMFKLLAYVSQFNRCPHLDSPRPMTALLNTNLILCNSCRSVLTGPDIKEGVRLARSFELQGVDFAANDQCDLCRKSEVTQFTPMIWHIGFLTIRGDVCDACFADFPPSLHIPTEKIDAFDRRQNQHKT